MVAQSCEGGADWAAYLGQKTIPEVGTFPSKASRLNALPQRTHMKAKKSLGRFTWACHRHLAF